MMFFNFGRSRMAKKRLGAIIDMDDFLITYGVQKLGPRDDIAETIYQAGKNNLNGLDNLFQDHGYGREQNFLEIASGFISDTIDPTKRNLNQIHKMTLRMGRQAMSYLGRHAHKFDVWKLQ